MSGEVKSLVGKKITKASSSLKNFSIEFEGENGLQLDAVDGPKISANVVANKDLPIQTEAVCSVDWSWIYTSELKQISVDGAVVRFQLDKAGALTVTAGTWQGSSFLGFQPYKPAAKV